MTKPAQTFSEKALTVGKAARMLGMSRSTLRRLEKAGRITSQRDANNYRYYKQGDVLQLKKELNRETSKKEAQKPVRGAIREKGGALSPTDEENIRFYKAFRANIHKWVATYALASIAVAGITIWAMAPNNTHKKVEARIANGLDTLGGTLASVLGINIPNVENPFEQTKQDRLAAVLGARTRNPQYQVEFNVPVFAKDSLKVGKNLKAEGNLEAGAIATNMLNVRDSATLSGITELLGNIKLGEKGKADLETTLELQGDVEGNLQDVQVKKLGDVELGKIKKTNGDILYISGKKIVTGDISNLDTTSITELGTISKGTWEGDVIGTQYGGTGISGYTTGDLIYATGSAQLGTLSLGTSGQILAVSNGKPAWTSVGDTLGGEVFLQNGNSFGQEAILGTNDTYSLAFETNNTHRMVITSAGDVGIGTTNPAYTLDVNGNMRIATGSDLILQGENLYTSMLGTRQFSSENYINSGETITESLDNLDQAIASTTRWVRVDGSHIHPSTSPLVAIMDAGSMGIGTTSPSYKLDVVGDVNTSGVYRINGSQLSTTYVPEGTNRYFTDARARNSISGVSPISYNSTTGAISIQVANTSQAGYLTSADWNTFNNKLGSSLAEGTIWIGNTSNVATARSLSGAITVDSLGVTTLSDDIVTGSKIAISGEGTGSLMYFDGTNWVTLGAGTSGQTLLAGSAPSWGQLDLTTGVTGILPIANGGTNSNATPTAGAVAYGTGTAIAYTAVGNAGEVLVSTGTGTPIWTDSSSVGTNYWSRNGTLLTPLASGDTIATTGNIGVGTTNPAYTLDVTGDINFTGTLRANGQPGTTGQLLVSNGTSSPTWQDVNGIVATSGWSLLGNTSTNPSINYIGTGDEQPLVFRTNATESARIDTSGNWTYATGKYIAIDNIKATTDSGLTLYDNDGNGIFIADGGDVGIGTTNPSYKLDVEGSLLAGNIVIAANVMQATNDSGIALRDNAGNGITILDGGNIGVGNTNPTSLLSVGSTEQFKVSSSGAITATGITSSGDVTLSGQYIALTHSDFSTAGGILKVNPTTGYLAIASGDDLPGNSDDYIQNQLTSAQALANYWISGTGIAETALKTPRIETITGDLTLDPSDGDVIINDYLGIGTTDPSESLQVVGNILASGTISNSTITLDGNTATSTSGINLDLADDAGVYALNIRNSNDTSLLSITSAGGITGTGTSTSLTMSTGTAFDLTNTGTGISFKVNDEASDSSPFTITANGEVGIGTESPDLAKLDVVSTINGIRLRAGNLSYTTSSNQILMSYRGTTSYTHAIKTRHNSGGQSGNAIDFYVWNRGVDGTGDVGTKQVMTLDGTGYVGINTLNPGDWVDINVTGTDSTDRHIKLGQATSDGTALGIKSPDGDLFIESTAITLTTSGIIQLDAGSIINTAGNWLSGDTDAEGIFIASNGSVGVGTSNPLAKLHVSGDGRINGLLRLNPVQITKVLEANDGADEDYFGAGVAISGDGSVLAVGADHWESGSDLDRGAVYIYDWVGGSWVQRGPAITAFDGADEDYFGAGVALSSDGSVLAVGAPAKDGTAGVNTGAVYIYDWNGDKWTHRNMVTAGADEGINDYFGKSTALSSDGTILAVGAEYWEGSEYNQGGVYIFDWDSTNGVWNQRGSVITAPDAASSDNFGFSTALSSDGTVLAVGAWKREDDPAIATGGTYVFYWNGATWVQRGNVILGEDVADYDYEGAGVALSSDGDILFVGAPTWEGSTGKNRGSVYTFIWDNSSWVQQGDPIYDTETGADDDYNGYSIALARDAGILVTGAQKWEGDTGTDVGGVYTYAVNANVGPLAASHDGTGWTAVRDNTLTAITGGTERAWIDSSGNFGIGTTSPKTHLEIGGDGSLLATGTYGSGWTEEDLGAGTRMLWYPRKAAFRAGYVGGTAWNDANIGTYSVALGNNTTASGDSAIALGTNTSATESYTTSMGYGTTASGYYATSMGYNTTASGNTSTALGFNNTASGSYTLASGYGSTASGGTATALGSGTTASGSYSTSLGGYTTASGDGSLATGISSTASGTGTTALGVSTHATAYASTALGRYNVGSGTTTSWVDTDPIFEVGIGTGDTARENALTILKNGRVGIGTTTPNVKLHIKGSDRLLFIEGDETYSGGTTGQVRIQGATDENKGLFMGFDTTNDFGFIGAHIAGVSWNNLILNPSGGNVGIGTTTPEYILDIGKNDATNEITRIRSMGNAGLILEGDSDNDTSELGTAFIKFSQDGGASEYYVGTNQADGADPEGGSLPGAKRNALLITKKGTSPIQFGNDSSIDMTINSSGYVGIGTTNPERMLHIASSTGWNNMLLENYSAADGVQLNLRNDTGYGFNIGVRGSANTKNNNSFFIYNTNIGAAALTIDETTNRIGIGTTTPGTLLHVEGTDAHIDLRTTGTTSSFMRFWADGSHKASIGYDVNSDVTKWVYGGGFEPSLLGIAINSSGYVGIGTTNPGVQLDVAGHIKATGSYLYSSNPNNNSAVVRLGWYNDGSTDWPSIRYGGSGSGATTGLLIQGISDSVKMSITDSGRVGIGTASPGSKLAIAGLGSSTGTTLVIDASGNVWKDSSSRRYKENIEPLEINPEELLDLQPVAFNYKETGAKSFGYIAEDVDELGIHNLVVYDNEGRPDALKYDMISVYLVEAYKEQKAQIDALTEKVNILEDTPEDTEDTPEEIADKIEETFDEFKDFVNALGLQVDEDTQTLIAGDDFTVLEDTTLSDTTITGTLSVGMIAVDSTDNSIEINGPSCITIADDTTTLNEELCDAQTLYLQQNLAGNINMMDGAIVFDPEGNVTIEGTLTAGTINTDSVETGKLTIKDENETIGQATIEAGDTEVTIKSEALDDNSYVFLTATTDTQGATLYVQEIDAEDGKFTIGLNKESEDDIQFNWWIISTTD